MGPHQKMTHYALSAILPKFWGNPGHSFLLSPKITRFVDSYGQELAEFWIKSAPQGEAGNAQKMAHFQSRLGFEIGHRRKMTDRPEFTKILGKSWSIHLSPRMAIFDSSLRLRIDQIPGKITPSGGDREMLPKMGHFQSRLEFRTGRRRKMGESQ